MILGYDRGPNVEELNEYPMTKAETISAAK